MLATDEPARQDFGTALTPAGLLGAGGPFDGVAPGALTRFMGVPWQTDGVSCNSSEYLFSVNLPLDADLLGSPCPDQVLSAANYDRAAALDPSKLLDPAKAKLTVQMHKHFMLRVEWLRDLRGFDFYNRIRNSVDEWSDLGMVLPIRNPPLHLPADIRFEQGRTSEAAGSDLKRKLVQAVEQLAAPSSSPWALNPTGLNSHTAEAGLPPRRDLTLTDSRETDVLVAGAGPAGATAADCWPVMVAR